MKKIIGTLIIALMGCLVAKSQSGAAGYGYNSPDSVEVVEVVEVIEVVDSLDYVDYSLYGILLDEDWYRLVADREEALSILDNLDADAYGLNEKSTVKRLLSAKDLKITNQELLAYRKVRSIQVGRLGIFSYPYFACRFRRKDGKIFFEKTSGSQRKSGYIYDNKPTSKVFMGGWSVNDDPQTVYGSENSEAGMLYKIGANKLIMLFIAPDKKSFEIYELIK